MTDDELYRKVPIAGMFSGSEPIVELGCIQIVPENQVILDDEPKSGEAYERKARVGLSVDEARQVATRLNEMADKLEEQAGE